MLHYATLHVAPGPDRTSMGHQVLACDAQPLPPRIPEVRRGNRRVLCRDPLNYPSPTTSTSSPLITTLPVGSTRIFMQV